MVFIAKCRDQATIKNDVHTKGTNVRLQWGFDQPKPLWHEREHWLGTEKSENQNFFSLLNIMQRDLKVTVSVRMSVRHNKVPSCYFSTADLAKDGRTKSNEDPAQNHATKLPAAAVQHCFLNHFLPRVRAAKTQKCVVSSCTYAFAIDVTELSL